nr:retrovirus-related Pol polyprotein from transposon TNT 1-94 [Tanacetum cinerariifolium]
MQKSLANKLRLKDRLYTFCMKPGISGQDHLDEFNTILIDLENLDVDINDEDKAVLLVISLPASYKHFKEIMLYDNRKTLSFDDVKSALLSKKKYDDDMETESGKGLVARGRSSDKEREGKGNKENKPGKAVKVAIAKGDSDGDVYLAIDTEKSRDELIVDSGCTFHMIPHWSWFTTYESFNDGNVYMGSHSICLIIGNGEVMKIFKGALVLMKAIQSGGLYVLQGTVVYGTAKVTTSRARVDDFRLWHYCLGHTGEKGMKNIAKKGLIKVSCNLEFCEHYVFGKQKRHKDEVFPTFKEWKVLIEKPNIKEDQKVEDQQWLEFCGESFNALCQKYGIVRHHTLVRTLQQKGVAVRMNRTVIEKVLCDSVDYSNLRVFGCPVYVHVNEGKLVPHAFKCIFLGYGFEVKGYCVWCLDPKYCKIIHSRDVTFNEDVITNSGKDFVPPYNVNNNYTEVKVEFKFDVENITHTQPLFNDELIKIQDDGNMPTNSYAFSAATHIKNYEPTNYLEAISCPERDKWVVAMEGQVESLHKLFRGKTLGLVKLPKEKHVISLFLHGHLEEEIYVEQPEGFKVLGNEDHFKPFPTPLESHFKLSSHECLKSKEDKEDMSRVPYSSAVGSLMYTMVCTRLDLAHAVSVVSRYMHNPGKVHWEVVKCILRYLKGTSNIGLSFKKGRTSPNGVVGYVDTNYVGDLDARKSLFSYIFSHCGFAISWYSSCKQSQPYQPSRHNILLLPRE